MEGMHIYIQVCDHILVLFNLSDWLYGVKGALLYVLT